MSNSLDSLLDFDLNFLNDVPKNVVPQDKYEKQRKAVLVAKKKTVATDSLIRRFYEKKESLEEAERSLLASKEECKQMCIEYKNISEKFSMLENENCMLKNHIQELNQQHFQTQSQVGAMQSHANQLQLLVKEKEELLESLNVDNKALKATENTRKKQIALLRKRNGILVQDIISLRNVVLGKKRINDKIKAIFNKFDIVDKIPDSDDSDSGAEQNDTCEWNDVPDSTNSPEDILKGADLLNLKKEVFSDAKAVIKGKESDEAVSVDTGRGSSLAFSDSEKCFLSPDYFLNDSPENSLERLRSIATSPMPVHLTSTPTSPIKIYDDNSTDKSVKNKDQSLSKIEKVIPVATVDRALSPIIFAKSKAIEIATSPIFFEDTENNLPDTNQLIPKTKNIDTINPVITFENIDKEIHVHVITTDEDNSNDSIQSLISDNNEDLGIPLDGFKGFSQEEVFNAMKPIRLIEKHCLEINSSNNVSNVNEGDNEVEMILNDMRLKENMITPMPVTPTRKRKVQLLEQIIEPVNEDSHACQEAVKAREETKVIHESLAYLAKEILSIKSILKRNRSDEVLPVNKHVENNASENVYDLPIPTSPSDVENPDFDPPIETCNITQPIETLDAPLYAKKLIACAKTNQSQNSVPENDGTPVHNTDTLIDRIQFEDGLSLNESIDKTSLTQNGREILSPNQISYSSDDIYNNTNHNNNSQVVTNCKSKVPKNKESPKESRTITEKARKLTRLEKMRKILIPKNKIKDAFSPSKRLPRLNVNKATINKNILTPDTKKQITEQDSAATLNDRDVYEKAIKVMAEIKSHQNKKQSDRCNIRKVKNTKKSIDNTIANDIRSEEVSSHTIVPKNHESPVKNLNTVDLHSNNNYQRNSPRLNEAKLKTSLDNHKSPLRTSNKVACNLFIIDKTQKISPIIHSEPNNNSNDNDRYEKRRCRKRSAETDIDFENKRITRSSRSLSLSESNGSVEKREPSAGKGASVVAITGIEKTSEKNTYPQKLGNNKNHSNIESIQYKENKEQNATQKSTRCSHPKHSLFCRTVEKHANLSGRRQPKKCKESLINNICKKIGDGLAHINDIPKEEIKQAMHKFADDLRTWKFNNFLSGLIKYLKNPERKVEMFNKVNCFPAPPMTKSEQTLVYVLSLLEASNPWNEESVIFRVLDSMEYTMLQLNNTPEFDVIESMSHFYAVLCRFKKAKSRLRLFLLDAMYCIQFKSIPLIKQCVEVWMHILPLAHMASAQNTLVICLVYLLHFYKCKDPFNRISEMRKILQKKYFFEITEWNDQKIIELFRRSVKQLQDVPVERKMLRMAFIILAKRMGPMWCQNNIIKNILLPLIENPTVPSKTKEFCVSILGPLMRPYPAEMKIHCEIVIQLLLDMLNQNQTPQMEEAIFTSLLYIPHRNFNKIIHELLFWNPSHVSPDFEELIKDFVKSKPVKLWKGLLSKVPLN